MSQVMRPIFLTCFALAWVVACASQHLHEMAAHDLACPGLNVDWGIKDGPVREQSDGTTHTMCCKNDHSLCAEYFCPKDEKSGCHRL